MTAVRLTATFFAVAFAGIIYLANTGQGGHYWSFLTGIPMGDKLGHIGLLGFFSLILNLSLRCRRLGPFLLGSCLLVTCMLIEEASQQFLVHRSFDLIDMLANLVGILAGGALSRTFHHRFFRPCPPAPPRAASNPAVTPSCRTNPSAMADTQNMKPDSFLLSRHPGDQIK
jgi:hypothetical protein